MKGMDSARRILILIDSVSQKLEGIIRRFIAKQCGKMYSGKHPPVTHKYFIHHIVDCDIKNTFSDYWIINISERRKQALDYSLDNISHEAYAHTQPNVISSTHIL
jgi:hypothetical protein